MQVISNILSNAIRFAKEGDIIISIERKVDLLTLMMARVIIIITKEKSLLV
jgi:signal transduction histidine kinase